MSKNKTPPKFSARYSTAWVVAYRIRGGAYVPCGNTAATREAAISNYIGHSENHWEDMRRAGYIVVKVRLVPII